MASTVGPAADDRGEDAQRDSVSVILAAFDLLDLAFEAQSVPEAIAELKLDLEVLPRERLVRVAMALAIEPFLVVMPPVDRLRFRERLQRRRLMLMVGPP